MSKGCSCLPTATGSLTPTVRHAVATLRGPRGTWVFQSHLHAALARKGVAGWGCKGPAQVSLGPPHVMMRELTVPHFSLTTPAKKQEVHGFEPDPCFSNHPQQVSHNVFAQPSLVSLQVADWAVYKGLIYTNMGCLGSGKEQRVQGSGAGTGDLESQSW